MVRRWLPGALRTWRFDASSGGQRWQGVQTFGQVNAEVGAAAGPVRRRASYYARNDPWIANEVSAIVANAIGAGIKPQSQHPDRAVREALHARWAAWTDQADMDGVTLDAAGTRVASWLHRNRPEVPGFSHHLVRVPAEQMAHLFQPLAPDSSAALSWLAPVLLRLRNTRSSPLPSHGAPTSSGAPAIAARPSR